MGKQNKVPTPHGTLSTGLRSLPDITAINRSGYHIVCAPCAPFISFLLAIRTHHHPFSNCLYPTDFRNAELKKRRAHPRHLALAAEQRHASAPSFRYCQHSKGRGPWLCSKASPRLPKTCPHRTGQQVGHRRHSRKVTSVEQGYVRVAFRPSF
jgi:hypothetical protein